MHNRSDYSLLDINIRILYFVSAHKMCAKFNFRRNNPNTQCPIYRNSEHCSSTVHKACILWGNPWQLRCSGTR